MACLSYLENPAYYIAEFALGADPEIGDDIGFIGAITRARRLLPAAGSS